MGVKESEITKLQDSGCAMTLIVLLLYSADLLCSKDETNHIVKAVTGIEYRQ